MRILALGATAVSIQCGNLKAHRQFEIDSNYNIGFRNIFIYHNHYHRRRLRHH